MSAEPFRPGDTVRLPFLVAAAGAIVNISDGIVSAVVKGRAASRELTVGDGITILDPAPMPAADGVEQAPHGIVTLDGDLTAELPLGRLTTLTVFFTNSAGVRMHTPPIWLAGVA